MQVSVIIPTHNRHQKLQETVKCLRRQDFPPDKYEIIIVDDGSDPPVTIDDTDSFPQYTILRLEGEERSIARNTGAVAAKGELLIFVDDDVSVDKNFLSAHFQAAQEFPDALAVGSIILPENLLSHPFVRFRQQLEKQEVPTIRGFTKTSNFCTAQNMSIAKTKFLALKGFVPNIISSEDQDFALRHTSNGGKIVFIPEARGVHFDKAFDIRSYCRRNEWGSRLMLPFYRKYPDLPQNIERERVNGFVSWGKEPFKQSVRKCLKFVLSSSLIINGLFQITDILERFAPNSTALNRIYRLLLGAHIFRGYRAAVKQVTDWER